MLKIKNFTELASSKYRKDALEIAEAGYQSIDTENAIKKKVIRNGNNLKILDKEYNLDEYKNVYIVGCGKVACQAAKTLEDILRNRVTAGAVIGINDSVCEIVSTYKGTHPMPSETNFKAAVSIEEIGENITEDDLVITIIGGGGSSLLCSSQSECDQGQKLYKNFLDSGGDISELNLVRKHISKLKGGGLAKILYPAKVIGLIFSDVPGDNSDENNRIVASGPTYIDDSTIEDAQKIIDKYDLGEFDLIETPKDNKYFEKVENFLIVSNIDALEAMQEKATNLGYKAQIAGTDLYNFPEETCNTLQEDSEPNSVTLAGGETRLIIPKDCQGKGGRSDYLAMEMLKCIKDNQVFVAFASDGHDNTDAAGVIIDQETKNKISKQNLEVAEYLKCLETYTFFEQTGDLIFTGKLESNVSDLMLLLTF